MLKRDLINEVSNHTNGLLKKDVEEALDIILDAIGGALSQGRRVEIRGFGSFAVRNRKARQTKNPRTGKVMNIPPRKTINFTMSKSLKAPLVEKN